MADKRILGIGMTSQRTRARMVERLREQGIRSEAVLKVMSEVPRHIFVDEALAHRAYDDTALPIGFAQTISNPYTVARMTEILVEGGGLGRVLEVGTGCGYQTAILAKLAKEVYSVERIGPLLSRARENLRELRLGNVRMKHADGSIGWSEIAPFDGIIMTAAATHLPMDFVQQLADGGRMVLPMGIDHQHLVLVERQGNEVRQTDLEPVNFVPLLPGIA